jgi:hypothetical protein
LFDLDGNVLLNVDFIMSESRPQNIPAGGNPKKVVIFAGPTTQEFKKQFSDSAKIEGAEAVEFVDVPEFPFDMSDDPKVKLELEVASGICEVYTDWFPDFVELFSKYINNISWNNETLFQKKTIHYLCDRIIHTPEHVLILNMEEPFYSYLDCASLNRSLFESAVNCLYLLNDKTNHAFAGLISQSIDEDIKLRSELSKWVSHKDLSIAKSAIQQIQFLTSQQQHKQEMLKGIGFSGNPPPFPNIRIRCDKLEDRWKFLYVSRYKELCSWSHIHLKQVFSSPSHARSSPKDLADAINTGTTMVYLAFHLVYLFLLSATGNQSEAQVEIDKCYQRMTDRITPILAKTGTFTPLSFTKET